MPKIPQDASEEVAMIYKKYQDALNVLEKERDQIIAEFRAALEKRKMENIRQELENSGDK